MTATTENATARPSGGLLALIAIGALAAGLWLGLQYMQDGMRRSAPVQLRSGTLLPHPRPLTAFELTGTDGKPFGLDRLKGHWSFLAIGYTSCPDVCPTTLANFKTIAKHTATLPSPPQFVFISVDPGRDTPKKLAHFLDYFDPAFLGATGPDPALHKLTGQLGLPYAKVQTKDSALGYVMDHSATVMLIDPQGRLTAMFSPPQDPLAMAQDFRTITIN
jgi:protein SCO1/2